jgi:chromosomal replication initiator protein
VTLEDRLRSRFEWGVIADIQPPDLETRIAILRQKARQEGLKIPADVLTYIAERVKSNIRELEGALKRIKVYAGLHNCPITLDVAREVLAHLLIGQPQARVTIEDVQRAVCDYFEITPQQLMGKNRSKKFSQPRHVALYLCRELTDLSFPDIAQKFGGKDHTSVIYACRKIKQAADDDPNMASILQYLTKQVEKG